DIFIAGGMAATVGHILGNRARDLVEIDAAVGQGLRELPLLAIGARGVGAAFVAPRQALVGAISVGLVCDDEGAGVGQRRRGAAEEGASQKSRKGAHAAPIE